MEHRVVQPWSGTGIQTLVAWHRKLSLKHYTQVPGKRNQVDGSTINRSRGHWRHESGLKYETLHLGRAKLHVPSAMCKCRRWIWQAKVECEQETSFWSSSSIDDELSHGINEIILGYTNE